MAGTLTSNIFAIVSYIIGKIQFIKVSLISPKYNGEPTVI
jgi:hypothetical protein